MPIKHSSKAQPSYETILILILGVLFIGEIASAWTALSPLAYPSSFHSLLVGSNQSKKIQSTISKECLKSIKRHLKNGGNFYSETMIALSVEVGEFPLNTVSDEYFYHYTNSPEAYKAAAANNMEEDFLYLRNRDNTDSWYLYVASDRQSSEPYGKYGINIHLHPHALIFMIREGWASEGAKARTAEIQNSIENELVENDPYLEHCRDEGRGADVRSPSILVRLATEASRISAIAYFGYKNQYPNNICKNCTGYQWLQIVGPWAIQNVKAFIK